MSFKITPETKTTPTGDGAVIVSGPGGSPWVTDPSKPHLGGNFAGGDPGTSYPDDLWPWLVKTFDVRTMVDVGCGTGETLRWFQEHVVYGFGVEGLAWNVNRGPHNVIRHDFHDGPLLLAPADLIWCADVAEHIAEEHVDNLLQTLRRCRVLAMCQGTDENEDGWHHVNNKPEAYWVEKLAGVGMIEDVAMTAESRRVGNHGWWQLTGRIYRSVDSR